MKDYTKDPLFLRQIIMDQYQNPRHKKLYDESEDYYEKHMDADSCIDDIKVQAKIKDGIIEDVVWDGVACVISTASTSIMSGLLKGKTIDQARDLIDTYNKMINLEDFDEESMQEAIAFSQVGKQANRIGCATIGWRAITDIIVESEENNVR